jgi:uncharacterized NAD(P)/FAD-binding protein YdhS
MQKIVIIGGGLSGTLLAINLLRNNDYKPSDITVIETNSSKSLGQAYSTEEHHHLLNVAAHKMSAFQDNSNHFTNWLSGNQYPFHDQTYVPRKIYRRYIQDLLKQELERPSQKGKYTFIHDTAIDIAAGEQIILLASGRRISFDKVVLALGNYQATSLQLPDNTYQDHPGYFPSAWTPSLFRNLPADKRIFIIGTGLTMVDTVLSLQAQQHTGTITALSTHGFLPLSHQPAMPYQLHGEDFSKVCTLLEALNIVNRHLKKARKQHIAWHAVIDAVRPYMQQIWINLPDKEKKKFMEHLRHVWGVARHRMPPECAQIIHQQLAQQKLALMAGRIKSIRLNADGAFDLVYQERGTRQQYTMTADIIINCMGPESNYTKIQDPLIVHLLAKGMIQPDALRLGINCTPEGIVLDNQGKQSPFLFTLGPPAKGILWEITSVPEIRVAAASLAELISSKKDTYAY